MATNLLLTQFQSVCRQHSERPALHVGGHSVTYRQLAQQIESWTQVLARAGMQPGERVLVVETQALTFIATWFALWRLGCVPVPLEASIPLGELVRATEESASHWMLIDVSVLETFPSFKSFKSQCVQEQLACLRLEPDYQEISAPESSLMFYTSGTTGTPKCVIHSHEAMAASIFSLADAMHLTPEDRILSPLAPMLPSALGTVVLQALCRGAEYIHPAQMLPGAILRELAATQATIFYAVPYMYELLCPTTSLRKSQAWAHIRLCLSSSAYLEPRLFEAFATIAGLPIRSVYCTSEIGTCTYNDADNFELLRDSVGTPLEGVRLRIVDAHGQAVPGGIEGQILVEGTHLASGYFRRPELQNQVFVADQVKTGDLGLLDAQGYLYLRGRSSETINASGYLVNPHEVEQVLLTHEAVAEVVVYGHKDAVQGEVVAAKIVLQSGIRPPQPQELKQFCASMLGHYKVPRQIYFVNELPKSRYGKIDRASTTHTAIEESMGNA